MRGPRFWLRWSRRDLRRRWQLVLAIGLLLAGGIGLAAGLASMRDWRVASNDASFAKLGVHDLRAEAEQGSYAPSGSLERAARRIPDAGEIAAASERLIAPTQIDASGAAGHTVITPGQVIGVETAPSREVDGVTVSGPPVDSVAVTEGEGLGNGAGETGGVLDPQYAKENGIEPPARITIAGGEQIDVTGLGNSPETFVVIGPGGSFSSESGFGTVFLPLAAAQRATGLRGKVNDLAIELAPGADAGRVASQLQAQIERDLPGFGVDVTDTADIDGRRILYDDADNDQQLFDVFAFLILAGAAFGAFNLISRTIESQRREIGIGMALGVEPRRLAIRPLLMGLQIAVAGVVLGILVGLAVNGWLRGLLADQLPLPFVDTDVRWDRFATRASIGFAIPLAAAAWPVWRGLRIRPIEAIEAGFRSARGGGLAPLLAKLPIPGRSLAQMPARNVLRAPRRTLLTVLASAAVISVAVSMSGMLDSFRATVDANTAEQERVAPDRLEVTLAGFVPADAPELRRLAASPLAAATDSRLSVPASLRAGEEEIDVVVDTIPGRDPVWTPLASAGSLPRGPGEVLIAESAAEDLGVGPGDRITLVHPVRAGPDRFETRETEVVVSGTHPDPFRFPVYMSSAGARAFGLAGRVNALDVVPPPGVGPDEVKRALLTQPGVATIESASTLGDALEEGLDEFGAIIRVVVVIAVILVLLIAFNSTAINADERAREYATMFAYGLPVRTVVRLAIVESMLIGLLATAAGVLLGVLILGWVVNVSIEEVLPELGVIGSLSLGTVVLAAVAGVGAMAAAPLLTIRRLRKMDVPSTLRVVE
ncbi:MAG: FtsX-like permease family protein [Solirubrobacterales bacterium]